MKGLQAAAERQVEPAKRSLALERPAPRPFTGEVGHGGEALVVPRDAPPARKARSGPELLGGLRVDADDDHRVREHPLNRFEQGVGDLCRGGRRSQRAREPAPRLRLLALLPDLAARAPDHEAQDGKDEEDGNADRGEVEEERVAGAGIDRRLRLVDRDRPPGQSRRRKRDNAMAVALETGGSRDDAALLRLDPPEKPGVRGVSEPLLQEELPVPVDDGQALQPERLGLPALTQRPELDAARDHAGEAPGGIEGRDRDDHHRFPRFLADQPRTDVGPARGERLLEVLSIRDVRVRDPGATRHDVPEGVAPGDPVVEELSPGEIDPPEVGAHPGRVRAAHHRRLGDRFERRDATREGGVDDEPRKRDTRAQVPDRLMLFGPVLPPGKRARDRGEHQNPDRRSAYEPSPDGTRRTQDEALDRLASRKPPLGVASPQLPPRASRSLRWLTGIGACHSPPFDDHSRTLLPDRG